MQQRFLLQILLIAQHVSGTTMPIIRSSRVLYGGCCLWYFVLWFSSCWSGVELRVMCPVCMMLLAVGILFPHINDDGRSKSHQIFLRILFSENFNLNSPFESHPHTQLLKRSWCTVWSSPSSSFGKLTDNLPVLELNTNQCFRNLFLSLFCSLCHLKFIITACKSKGYNMTWLCKRRGAEEL